MSIDIPLVTPWCVTLANAGVQGRRRNLDSRFRGNDAADKETPEQGSAVASLAQAKTQQVEFMRVFYMRLAGAVVSGVRLFTGINLLVLAHKLPSARFSLLLPALLLVLTTLLYAWLFLFDLDGFFFSLHNPWLWYGYLLYIGLVVGLYVDIVLLRARYSGQLANRLAAHAGRLYRVNRLRTGC